MSRRSRGRRKKTQPFTITEPTRQKKIRKRLKRVDNARRVPLKNKIKAVSARKISYRAVPRQVRKTDVQNTVSAPVAKRAVSRGKVTEPRTIAVHGPVRSTEVARCKPRPVSNVSKGGNSRDYVPWCGRRR